MGFLKGIWCTALSSINNRWKKLFDSNEVFGAILTDLSKTFDRICHDLLDTKLNAYSALSLPALKTKNKNWTPIQCMVFLYLVFLRDRF